MGQRLLGEQEAQKEGELRKGHWTGLCRMIRSLLGFPGGTLVVKNLPANAGDIRDMGSIPGLRGSPEAGHGNPLQYTCLETPKDREAWRATAHRVAKSRTRLKQLSQARTGWKRYPIQRYQQKPRPKGRTSVRAVNKRTVLT